MDQFIQLLNQYWEKVKLNWDRLKVWQKIAFSSILAIIFAITISIFSILPSEDEFAVLFGDLAPEDASTILTNLKDENIKYILENDGRTILIRKNLIFEKRLSLAAEGLPQSGAVGYEIFDKNNIGLTDFVQQLNFKRALEGELSRTIQSINRVKFVRVHIMVPKPSLFIEDDKPTTASVMLHLDNRQKLGQSQVDGIANLVASSVEGLETEKVTIVDSHGNVLTKNQEHNSLIELTSSQLDLQMKVEKYLEGKLGSLLLGVVGQDNYIVRVSTKLNFDQIERTSESYDPESATIRSQESNTEGATDPNATQPQSDDTITNYEISKSVERMIGGIGSIDRLSVAVMVNGTHGVPAGSPAGTAPQQIPRTDEEIQKVTSLVQNAVGFDAGRGDQVQVTNVFFDTSEFDKTQQIIHDVEQMELYKTIGKYVSLAVAAVILINLLRGIFESMQPKIEIEEEEEELDFEDLEMPMETQVKLHKRKIINEIANDKPKEVSKLIRTWLFELEKTEPDNWSTKN
ncbi:MAG: flagellar M-ring protein FliF [Calditrichaeota bacterium]|nr:MAG: flagellar M-ring protein FliF [Calditrichota bacterium]